MSEAFFSQKNETMLHRVLYNDVCRRTGGDLNEKQAGRLMKTVKHYMTEVHRVQGNKPVNTLNSEVLTVVLSDYMMYIERSGRSDRSVMSDMEAGDGKDELPSDSSERPRIQDDVGSAFSKMQASRQEVKSRPPIQDFRLTLQDEGTVSMDVFDRIKKDREAEAERVNAQQLQLMQQDRVQERPRVQQQSQQTFAEATDMFSRGNKRAAEESEAAFAARERASLEARASTRSDATYKPQVPDIRSLVLGDTQNLDRRRPVYEPPQQPTSSGQLVITREPGTMAYRENELNLFVYSGDRDWVSNSSESRYNFTVNFDPSNLPTGLRLNPTSTVKFRNIVRIELVKAIVPGEGLDLLVTKTGATTYDSSVNMNVLSYPYIQVRIPELDNNVYGTNNGLNAAFGVLQYDANWISDTGISNQRGFLAMIPKFLKCQKVYTPTPLATIQKLSFRFERPDGTLLSSIPDTVDITRIYPTIAMTTGNFPGAGALTNTFYKQDPAIDTNSSAYYWLQTTNYFNHWTVSKGDRVLIRGLTFASTASGSAALQLAELLPYLQRDGGFVVVDTGVVGTDGSGNKIFSNSYNSAGYANAILVSGKFSDPTTGSVYPSTLGGVVDQYANGYLAYYLANTGVVAGRVLNQSHQVQISMRVITRELDSTGVLRPDNL
jgi:hypothetical protein